MTENDSYHINIGSPPPSANKLSSSSFTFNDVIDTLYHWNSIDDASFDLLHAEIGYRYDDALDRDKMGEELDYLLMAGIIQGDDDKYRMSDSFWDMPNDERVSWVYGERDWWHQPLVDPRPLNNDNPRNRTRRPYEWEGQIAVSFELAWGMRPCALPLKIAILKGNYLSSFPLTVTPAMVMTRLTFASIEWRSTDEGSSFIDSCPDNKFSLDLLGTEIPARLRHCLEKFGLLKLEIVEHELEEGYYYDQLL